METAQRRLTNHGRETPSSSLYFNGNGHLHYSQLLRFLCASDECIPSIISLMFIFLTCNVTCIWGIIILPILNTSWLARIKVRHHIPALFTAVAHSIVARPLFPTLSIATERSLQEVLGHKDSSNCYTLLHQAHPHLQAWEVNPTPCS